MEREPTTPVPGLPETWEEALGLGMPNTPEAKKLWWEALKAEKDMNAELARIMRAVNAKTEPRPIKLGETTHKLSMEERKARREKNKARHRQCSPKTTGPQAWLSEAKGKTKRRRDARRALRGKG